MGFELLYVVFSPRIASELFVFGVAFTPPLKGSMSLSS
jgi:hypothetical protein